MKNFNNLLIIGDSFCEHRVRQSDWPVALGRMLDCKVHGRGWGGCAWWNSKKELDKYKSNRSTTVLIVVHTDSNRLPNDFNYPITPRLMQSLVGGTIVNDVVRYPWLKYRQLALDFYSSELFSMQFYEWAHAAWINEIDQCNDFYATIHIPAFDNVNLSKVKNGIVLTPDSGFKSLMDISNAELGTDSCTWAGRDTRNNHFKDFNNIKLAEALRDVIVELPPSGAYTFSNMAEWELNSNPL
jgi:hypothetical protein